MYTYISIYLVLYTCMYPLYLYAYAAPPQEQCQLTDQLLEQYSDDIKMMNNRGRPIIVDHPPPPSMVESHALAHVDQDWRGTCTFVHVYTLYTVMYKKLYTLCVHLLLRNFQHIVVARFCHTFVGS